MSEDEPLMVLTKALAGLVGEYREIAERIVIRADRGRYLLAADRDHLAALNASVKEIVALLTRSERVS